MEIWKTIKDYPDYQVSNLGNVKSLKWNKEKILISNITKYGYYKIGLCEKGIERKIFVHQLVAIAFFNHNPCGLKLVINHKNFIRTDNRVENLEIVTMRENGNQKHRKSSSKYVGVNWHKQREKWRSYIWINGKYKHLGLFKTELEAHNAYQNALLKL